MAEIRNIVIIGASYGGLSAAHYIAKHTLPQLQRSQEATYHLHLIDPSTHFWWHIAAPREIVSVKEAPHSNYFVKIDEGFKQYSNLKDSIIFHQGEVTEIDVSGRKVSVKVHEGGYESLEYYALVIASGIRSPTPLTTLHGDYKASQKALEDMNQRLASAKDIIIGGGGPVGVETAGEIGTHLHGKANITLLTAGDKLLPIFQKSRSEKAEKMLSKNGVSVRYKARIAGSEPGPDGKTVVKLESGETMSADVYIPCVGVSPNTSFLPDTWKKPNGYVKANPKTLRVDDAGPRVYVVGDVADVDKGGVLNLFNSLPVFGANFSHDVLADARVGNVAERQYQYKAQETQLVPIGAKTGVGAFNGWSMPAFAVSMFKGKDYMKGQIPNITQGKQWTKA